MKIKINVTLRDIQRGRPGEPTACPIARAIKRKIRAGYVRVHPDEIMVKARHDGGPDFVAGTTPEITEFIEEFDDLHDVEPFRFTLDDGG